MLELLILRLEQAIASGDQAAIILAMQNLEAYMQPGNTDIVISALKDFYQTHNLTFAPVNPHGDQNTQVSIWEPLGSVCGLLSTVPRYWQLTFDWSPSGEDYEVWFGPGGIFYEYRYWFRDIAVKRGPMLRPPAVADGTPAGSYDEAVQQRFEVEYGFAYWKRRMPPHHREAGTETLANGLNVAWFLWYGYVPGQGQTPTPIDEPDLDNDDDWRVGIIENQRVKPTGSGTTWENAYSPLMTYKLVPPYRDAYGETPEGTDTSRATVFRSRGPNIYEPDENFLNFPRHILTLKPFYP